MAAASLARWAWASWKDIPRARQRPAACSIERDGTSAALTTSQSTPLSLSADGSQMKGARILLH
eukprot:9426840-Pyramimonas_sp.AAC.1